MRKQKVVLINNKGSFVRLDRLKWIHRTCYIIFNWFPMFADGNLTWWQSDNGFRKGDTLTIEA